MPLTFIDIERQKNWRIALFFLVLLFIYLCIAVVFSAMLIPFQAGYRIWIFSAATALLVAGIHFWFSAYDTVRSVLRSLDASSPDPQDDIHKTLINVMEEVHIATGNKRKIECFVIPSLSLNALAVADLKGNAAVGITEGLLSRLTRPQLESVVAHEAHHILSGDCLETTIAASLFGMYASFMDSMNVNTRGRASASPALPLVWSLLKLSYLLNMFISREREYRADAAAVRMTRNPIALAETLYLLSRSWRGAGFIGSGLEMVCIVNPEASELDEKEGFWADLLSTHPPLQKRIDIMLGMARVSIAELEAKAREKRGAGAEVDHSPRYYAMNPGHQWQGPFTLAELQTLPWLSPLTWVTKGKEQPVGRAWKQSDISSLFEARLKQEKQLSSYACPVCRQPLAFSSYEGTQVYQCSFCAGTLLENQKIPRILARTDREQPCSERINSLAKAVVGQNQANLTKRMLAGVRTPANSPRLSCPKCKNQMFRTFYSSAHLIEIDRCSYCEMTWFDQDELAMLQCLIENRIMPEPVTDDRSQAIVAAVTQLHK